MAYLKGKCAGMKNPNQKLCAPLALRVGQQRQPKIYSTAFRKLRASGAERYTQYFGLLICSFLAGGQVEN